jgi:hypothetical protein
MLIKTYWRMWPATPWHDIPTKEECPFTLEQAREIGCLSTMFDFEKGLPILEALRLVNKWNRQAQGRQVYWLEV